MKKTLLNMLNKLFPVYLVGMACLLGGCGIYSYLLEDPYVKVEESGLNWLNIRYYDQRVKPVYRINLRLDGNGYIVVRSGTSMLVSDQFAKKNIDSSWEDVYETRTTISPAEVVPILQDLVDNDLFNKDRIGKAAKTPNTNEYMAVSAAINNKTYTAGSDNMFDKDPDLAERCRNIILNFYHPRPKHLR